MAGIWQRINVSTLIIRVIILIISLFSLFLTDKTGLGSRPLNRHSQWLKKTEEMSWKNSRAHQSFVDAIKNGNVIPRCWRADGSVHQQAASRRSAGSCCKNVKRHPRRISKRKHRVKLVNQPAVFLDYYLLT